MFDQRQEDEQPGFKQAPPPSFISREEFLSLRATVQHLVSALRRGGYLTSLPVNDPKEIRHLDFDPHVIVGWLDQLDSFMFLPSRFDSRIVDFFRNLPERHFIKTAGIEVQRSGGRPSMRYKGAWIAPASTFSEVMEFINSLGLSFECVIPRLQTRTVTAPNITGFLTPCHQGLARDFSTRKAQLDPKSRY